GRQQQISSATGLHYNILAWCPHDAEARALPQAGGLPVTYVPDRDDLFLTLAETLRRLSRRPPAPQEHPVIVSGIEEAAHERRLDFTRGPAAEEPGNTPHCGGAGDFMRFLDGQLLPWVEQNFPVNPRQRSLFGHSLAGYFALQALAIKPRAFANVLAISPSLW